MSPLFPSSCGSYSTIPSRTPLNIGWDEFRNSKRISTTNSDMSKKCHRIRNEIFVDLQKQRGRGRLLEKDKNRNKITNLFGKGDN
jgi:hypothetical protein